VSNCYSLQNETIENERHRKTHQHNATIIHLLHPTGFSRCGRGAWTGSPQKNAYHQFFEKTQSFCCVQAFFVPQKCMSILEVFLEGKKCTSAYPENCGYGFFPYALHL